MSISLESPESRNSAISDRRMEKTEGCLLRSSSENRGAMGFSMPVSPEPVRSKDSQSGCSACTGSKILIHFSPRSLRARNSTLRAVEINSMGGQVEAISQREYRPGNSYPEER